MPSNKQQPCRTHCTDTQGRSEENVWVHIWRQDVLFLVSLPCNPQTTTCQTPASMLMMRRPRFRFDLVCPVLDTRVLDKQTTARERHDVALSPREFYASTFRYIMFYALGLPAWRPRWFWLTCFMLHVVMS